MSDFVFYMVSLGSLISIAALGALAIEVLFYVS